MEVRYIVRGALPGLGFPLGLWKGMELPTKSSHHYNLMQIRMFSFKEYSGPDKEMCLHSVYVMIIRFYTYED